MWVCDQALHIYQFPRVSLSPGEVVLSLRSDRCRAIWRLFIMMAPPLDEASHRIASHRVAASASGAGSTLSSPHTLRCAALMCHFLFNGHARKIDEREDPASMKGRGVASTNLLWRSEDRGDGKDIFPFIFLHSTCCGSPMRAITSSSATASTERCRKK